MNKEKVINGAGGEQRGTPNKELQQKPIFTITPSTYFVNLHFNAQESAVEAIRQDFKDSGKNDDYNKIILNTAMSEDGRTFIKHEGGETGLINKIANKLQKFTIGKVFEIGIIFQVSNTPEYSEQNEQEFRRQVTESIENLRATALKGINAYYAVFCGRDDDQYDENGLQLFVADTEGATEVEEHPITMQNYTLPKSIEINKLIDKLIQIANKNSAPSTRPTGNSEKGTIHTAVDAVGRDVKAAASKVADKAKDVADKFQKDNKIKINFPRLGFKVQYRLTM